MPPSTPIDASSAVLGVLTDLPVTREATTSRVLVNNPLLRVVVFAFDAGQVLTSHSSPRAVTCTVLTGTLDFEVEGQRHAMAAGDVLYLAPGAVHAVEATSPCHLQLVMVDTQATA